VFHVAVSEFSRQDIIQLTGMPESRITNTYQAVQLPPRLLARDESTIARELEALFGLGMQDYFLFVGAIEPKKNLSRLIDAYAASGVDRPLIIAGGLGWMFEGDVKKMESERFLSYRVDGTVIKPQRSVRQLSYLPFDHLISLMRGARALLFPSLYEGFGLPVLEAMMLGTPVMTSNISSLPEIAGDAALTCDPYDIDAMGKAIRQLDADGDLKAELAARGRVQADQFSPARYATRIQKLYASLL
jgi:glycosyltransferase involved in cell wall biosynthesis